MVKELNLCGCNKKYLIYDDGRIYDIKEEKFRQPRENKKGYDKVSFYIDGKYKRLFVHRLVLMTFKPVEGMENLQVNHIDGNKKNNRLENLEWCTQKENIEHAIVHGLFKNCIGYGDNSHHHKITQEIANAIKADLLAGDMSIRKIASKYGISPSTVCQIRSGKTWR